MNKDKVYLKGYVIGHAADTLGYKGLMVQLENLDIVEIDENHIHREIDELQPIKLKNVITRIKGFDPGTQKVWLNEILNELGSDYGTLKYMAGYDQGKLEGEWVGRQLKDADKTRQELNKPVVPQFVADWYEDIVDEFYVVLERLVLNYKNNTDMPICKWFFETEDALTILINMHQFGYTVEEEKRYYVRFKWIEESYSYLTLIKHLDTWTLSSIKLDKKFRMAHTRKQLEDADFGWVFDCPGMEVEEVE